MYSSKRRKLSTEATGADSGPNKPIRSVADRSKVLDPSHSGDDTQSGSTKSSDTEDEIAGVRKSVKSKQTQKRKRRATSPTQFGATLQSLLSTKAPSTALLSLKPSISTWQNDDKLEVKAKKLLEGEKKEKEEKNHVTDVIGDWGGESERSLRKVAQRGVVRLFNAIQQAQTAVAAEVEEAKAHRGSGKPTLSAPSFDAKSKRAKKAKGTAMSSETSGERIGQDAFLQMIKSGGLVSRA